MDKATGKSKGFAFVEMPKVGEAKIAIGKLNNMELEGSKIRVKKAEQ
jgi:RNA recognition motif-containing protein